MSYKSYYKSDQFYHNLKKMLKFIPYSLNKIIYIYIYILNFKFSILRREC